MEEGWLASVPIWVAAGFLAGIHASGAFEVDVVPEAYHGVGDAGDVNGFRSDSTGTETIEDVH